MGSVALRACGRPDYGRWSNPDNLETWWDERTARLAALVPAGSRVIEFGAGRRQLPRFLDPASTYVASDLVDRGDGTIVCDLNQRPLPDLRPLRADVAVFGGVIEYLRDLRSLTGWLGVQVTCCVLSYAPATAEGPKSRVAEWLARSSRGYVNAYTADQLVRLFESGGFTCTAVDRWNEQVLFRFVRNAAECRDGAGRAEAS